MLLLLFIKQKLKDLNMITINTIQNKPNTSKATSHSKVFILLITTVWLLFFQFIQKNADASSTTYYSLSSGDWANSIWSNTTSGGPNCSCDPGSNHNKVANVTYKLTVSTYSKFKMTGGGIINVSGNGGLVINSDFEMTGNSELHIANGDTVIVNGDLKLSGGSQIDVSGYFQVNGNATLTGGSSVCGSGSSFLNGTLTGSTWCGSVLPIKLSYFRVKQENSTAKLTWATATEIKNDFFTVERSPDGINFSELFDVMGAGNSTMELEYSSTDNDPIKGYNYYRLRQTDYDGNSEYSEIISFKYINAIGENKIIASSTNPNPFINNFTINYSIPKKENVEVQIATFKGNLVYSETVNANEGENAFTFNDTKNLFPGIYNVRIILKGEVVSKKIIKY